MFPRILSIGYSEVTNGRRRNIVPCRCVGRRSVAEQFRNRGVYIGVFEQSLLIENATNKSWSFLASVSAELVAVSLLILIPLIYGDHLPEFHWRSVTLGAPSQPIKRVVQVQAANG